MWCGVAWRGASVLELVDLAPEDHIARVGRERGAPPAEAQVSAAQRLGRRLRHQSVVQPHLHLVQAARARNTVSNTVNSEQYMRGALDKCCMPLRTETPRDGRTRTLRSQLGALVSRHWHMRPDPTLSPSPHSALLNLKRSIEARARVVNARGAEREWADAHAFDSANGAFECSRQCAREAARRSRDEQVFECSPSARPAARRVSCSPTSDEMHVSFRSVPFRSVPFALFIGTELSCIWALQRAEGSTL